MENIGRGRESWNSFKGVSRYQNFNVSYVFYFIVNRNA